jgi:serine/threonine protein phosphatase PrpC
MFYLADGIYDNLSNKEILKIIWTCLHNNNKEGINKQKIVEIICNEIIKKSVEYGSNDNLSLIFIAFDNFFNNHEKIEIILNRITSQDCESMII